MLTFSIRQPAPPATLIMLYHHHLGIFATGNLTDAEPEEHSFTVFLILVEVAKINVTIGVELDIKGPCASCRQKCFSRYGRHCIWPHLKLIG